MYPYGYFFDDIIGMDLWDRIREKISSKNTKQSAIAELLGIHEVTFRKWMSKKINPDAFQIYSIAKFFGVTVEELVDGDAGRDYILTWANKHGSKWKPPDKLRGLCELADNLSEEELSMLMIATKALADAKKNKNQLEQKPRADAV